VAATYYLAGRTVSIKMTEDFGFKRIHDRKTYATEVIFSHHDKAYAGRVKNISLGGAFVATSSVNQFSSGDVITLSIPFTAGQKHLKRKGRIQWLNNEGFAIEFI
jgi:Tfp pilus assembly protein PilZ